MVTIDKSLYQGTTLKYGFCIAITATLASSFGLFSAMIWRDLIFGILKRNDVWDSDKGLETKKDIIIVLSIAVGATIFTALVVLVGAKLCAK